ncbi:MAG TPA: DUF3667 domain-containing protein [Allosphingosinicella sp.]|nr:DUF3667 domain-containing protein [Allosphingosinicella sp.]
MVSGIEGVGEAVTGGMLARAVEPSAGEDNHAQGGNCLNCGVELAGDYCHRCGQKALVHRTIGAWWHDFLHSVLHLDGKFWRTLPLLAWRPGELTRRYVEGERARFISPLALFLFSVFLMFAVFSFSGSAMFGVDDPMAASRDIAAEVGTLQEEAAQLEAQRRQRAAAGAGTAALDSRLAELRQEIEQIEAARGVVSRRPMFSTNLPPRWDWVERGMRKANENPALLFYKIQTNAYKFSWALIPISVPFLWLLFLHRARYRRAYHAYDHLVFVTYSIAFMSLALITFWLLRSIGLGGGLIEIPMVLVPPVHVYRQLKGAYRLSRFSAAWRTVVLLVFASVSLMLFLLLLLAIGVLG